jgi:flagellar biosynthesis protein FlhB
VPRARDLAAAASWVAVCCALAWALPGAAASLRALAVESFSRVPAQADPAIAGLVPASLDALAALLAPPLVACWAAVLVASFLYTGPTFSWHAVSPRLDRLSPAAGLRRVFSGERWFTVLRDVIKLALVLALAGLGLKVAIRPALAFTGVAPDAAPALLGHVLVRLAALLGAGAAVFALVDATWSRHAWMRKQRMTVGEFRRELRETEGDPSFKGRRRQIHREISEHRMLEEVRKASFVLVNPTRVAVALAWDESEMDAPTVVASGESSLARRIVREARRAGVPVVHHAPLARSLADLAPGEMIPEQLYEAVAAVVRALEEE